MFYIIFKCYICATRYDNFDVHTTAVPLYPVRTAQEKDDEERIKDILKW